MVESPAKHELRSACTFVSWFPFLIHIDKKDQELPETKGPPVLSLMSNDIRHKVLKHMPFV